MFNWTRRAETTQIEPAKLDKILTKWKHLWAEEHGNATVKWIEYTRTGLEKRLKKNHIFLLENRYLSFKDVEASDVITTTTELEEKKPYIFKDGSTWKVAIENSSYTDQPAGEFADTVTSTTSKQVTWTSGVTLNLGAALSGGIPLLLEGKTTIALAFNKSKATAELESESILRSVKQSVKGTPGKKISASIDISEKKTTINSTFNIYLQGYVVICCESAIVLPEISDPLGPHKKWYISIHQIFQDLKRVTLP